MPRPSSSFLESTDIVDWRHDSILRLAAHLADQSANEVETARRCFEWVRDEIRHSSDYQLNPVTCSASEVLLHGTGYCYQRLSVDETGPPFCLHGLNAVHLPELGWYRVDPRGNRNDLHAEFCPPEERLAFSTQLPGEKMFGEVLHTPLQAVIDCLRRHDTWEAVSSNLPDAESDLLT